MSFLNIFEKKCVKFIDILRHIALLQQKKKENEEALRHLHDRIMVLDKLEGAEKIKALILGVLSGNIFDWGAKDVAKLLETTDFGFEEAQAKIPSKLLSSNT